MQFILFACLCGVAFGQSSITLMVCQTLPDQPPSGCISNTVDACAGETVNIQLSVGYGNALVVYRDQQLPTDRDSDGDIDDDDACCTGVVRSELIAYLTGNDTAGCNSVNTCERSVQCQSFPGQPYMLYNSECWSREYPGSYCLRGQCVQNEVYCYADSQCGLLPEKKL
jgi:hypothetical protein